MARWIAKASQSEQAPRRDSLHHAAPIALCCKRWAEVWFLIGSRVDETGDRGAEPKYTAETGKRILALLDQPPPKGFARWSGSLLAEGLGIATRAGR